MYVRWAVVYDLFSVELRETLSIGSLLTTDVSRVTYKVAVVMHLNHDQ
jgi:hypothetical protein